MTRGTHPKADVRTALDNASAAGLHVVATPDKHGHSWGYIDCPECDQRFYVNSTPKNTGNHAKQIYRFVRRHEHPDA